MDFFSAASIICSHWVPLPDPGPPDQRTTGMNMNGGWDMWVKVGMRPRS